MKIGLLPLYIKLYDDININQRIRLKEFYEEVTNLFKDRGVEVITSDFCRIKPEFDVSITVFEKAGVDAIVTLHMAYSPSLESIEALTKTELPVIVLDSTPTLEFTPAQDPEEINYCHGIHGVMDMCSMLKRHGKPYAIAAGHYKESDCIDRVCDFVRAAVAARALHCMKVGLIGGGFEGMGDFAVSPESLKECFGITVEAVPPEKLRALRSDVTEAAIAAEMAENEARFGFSDDIIQAEYTESVASCLTLRACLEQNGYSAFSVNFLNIDGLSSMPFIECCKAMERGIGYAGEGDALTAAFTGALMAGFPETNFVEIFCPDWKNNTVFMSHMGEVNYRIAAEQPVIHRAGSNFTQGPYPYVGYAKMQAGRGVYVNVSLDADGYQLLLATGEMLPCGEDRFTGSMRGWFRPDAESTASFLEDLSRNGATHHSSFVYGATVEALSFFGQLLSLKTVII